MSGDNLFLISLFLIWLMLLYHMFLTLGGYYFSLRAERLGKQPLPDNGRKHWPRVTVLIPAHNEEIVIHKTLESMVNLDYPKDRLQVIVINDNSSDRTGAICDSFAEKYSFIQPLHCLPPYGGKGKAVALNRALAYAKGEYIAVYDADNYVEKQALKRLVAAFDDNPHIGAVVGKFRVINAYKNLLTRFINIETISHQWMAQAGRWFWFKICTIPGTNFMIRRHILEQIGGWDSKALAEDTELSIRVYEAGYMIRFYPLAVTWEQEPETWKVWFKQRIRWARGNQYVILKYLPRLFLMKRKRIFFDLVYFFFTYFLFLSGVMLSNSIFVLNLLDVINLTLPGPYLLIWLLAYLLFILEIMITLAVERTELTLRNFFTVMLMYLSYSQLWIIVVIYSFILHVKSVIFREELKWEKTQRFENRM